MIRSERLGAWLKCENLQVTGSFKVRGGLAAVDTLRRDVVAASAGNHGQGLALAAKLYGVACTIVVPRTVPKVKEEAIRSHGATVVKAPFDGYDDTEAWARAQNFPGVFVSPFDDDAVIAGNGGTLALEILEDAPDTDTIAVPLGGGGCAIGCGVVAKPRGVRVIGVNTDASPGMWMSRRDGRPHLRVESAPTIAEGIEGGVSAKSFDLANRYVDDVVVVPEASLGPAIAGVLKHERMLIEGAAAAAVAARVRSNNLVIVLSGSNIDLERVAKILTS